MTDYTIDGRAPRTMQEFALCLDMAEDDLAELRKRLSDGDTARTLLREAFNAMDEVRCTLNDRGDKTGVSSVLAMTLADSQRDIKAFLEGQK